MKIPTIREIRKICVSWDRCDWAILISSAPVIPYFTKFFLLTGIHANVVTFIWGVMGVISGILYIFGDYWLNLLALLVLHLSYVLDGVDGLVARLQNKCSVRGSYLDLVNHSMIKPLVLLGMSIGTFFKPPNYIPLAAYWYLIFGALGAIFIVNANVARLKVYETYVDKERKDIIKIMKKRFKTIDSWSLKTTISFFFRVYPLGLIYWATIFNFIWFAVLFYGVTMPLIFIARTRKEFLAIKNEVDTPELK